MNRPSLSIITVVLLAGGCAHALRRQHAKRFDCPLDQTSVITISRGHLESRGCGHVVTYACPGNTGSCRPVDEDGPEDRDLAHPHESSIGLVTRRSISPTCNGARSAPSTQTTPVGVQACGLVYEEITDPEYLQRFSAQLCDGAAVDEDAACWGRWQDMYAARLMERYPLADVDQVQLKCRAHPLDCQSGSGFEAAVLASHNTGVRRVTAAELAQSDEDDRQRRAAVDAQLHEAAEQSAERSRARRAAVAAALQEAFRQPVTTRCTTNAYGNTTQTECTTR